MTSTLGPYQIEAFLASGGMADVYLGRHRTEGFLAALKVADASPVWRTHANAFLREVQASASLSHPSIVAVYDYGSVTAAEALVADGKFREGSLWLAMEYATHGTLDDVRTIPRWSTLRRIVMDVLDGLAYAHARGVIHRDLKPGNILLTERDGLLALLLADFGIAHVIDPEITVPESTEDIAAPAAGTPTYMAPEQFYARWRNYGPWTDLYSLGCLVWDLVTGEPPFAAQTAVELATKHTFEPVPDFEPSVDVPDAFEEWLRRLLEKRWWDRYTRVADAAWALSQIEGGDGSASSFWEIEIDPTASGGAQTLVFSEDDESRRTLRAVTVTQRVPSVELRGYRTDRPDSTVTAAVAPPFPDDWRRLRPDGVRDRRTGIGLFGVREVPLVDREPERDVMWGALSAAVRGGSARAVVVEAGRGRGKSKLLRWLRTRAHELGAATVLQAGHGVIAGPADGLPRMLARHLGCGGLGGPETFDRLRTTLERLAPDFDVDTEAALLTRLVTRLDPDEMPDHVPRVEFGSPIERYSAVGQYLRLLARIRPVLVTLDDVQRGHDALGLVEHVLDASDDTFPILFALAVRTDALDDRPLESRRIASLAERDDVDRVEFGTLSRDDHARLVDELLGVDAALARKLVSASGGDPIYSVCVVADWVQRDVLVPGPSGYRIGEGLDASLPTSVVEACEARFDRICATFARPARVREALQFAAALGEAVEDDEWRAVCERRGVEIPDGLVAALVDAGLARNRPGGFAFSFGVMVDALEAGARRTGRYEEIHALCAATVTRAAQNGTCVSERRARHLLAARRPHEALAALATAVERRMASSAYDEALALTELYFENAERHGVDRRSERGVRVLAMRAEALRYSGDEEGALQTAGELRELANRGDVPLAEAEGLRIVAGLDHHLGHSRRGIGNYTRAMECYERVGDDRGVSKCAHGRGWLHLNLGNFATGRDDFRRAVDLARKVDSRLDLAWSLQGLAEATLHADAPIDEADAAATEAIALSRELGSRSAQGMALTTLGNIAAASDRLDEAREYYERAIGILSSFGSPLVAFAFVNAATIEVFYGSPDTVRTAVERITDRHRARMPVAFRIVLGLVEVYLATAEPYGDIPAALQSLAEILPDSGFGLHPVLPRLVDTVLASHAQVGFRTTLQTLMQPILAPISD